MVFSGISIGFGAKMKKYIADELNSLTSAAQASVSLQRDEIEALEAKVADLAA